jgi:hypothetical protein
MVWKEIANVFSVFTTRLFSVNHVCNSVITLFSLYLRLFIFSSDTNMFVVIKYYFFLGVGGMSTKDNM